MKTNESTPSSSSRPIDARHNLPSNSLRIRVSEIFQFGVVGKMGGAFDSKMLLSVVQFQPTPRLFCLTPPTAISPFSGEPLRKAGLPDNSQASVKLNLWVPKEPQLAGSDSNELQRLSSNMIAKNLTQGRSA